MKTICFLHGALGTAEQLRPLINQLPDQINKHPITFEGHGPEPMPMGPFRIESFGEQVLREMDEQQVDKASFFGYSMGGYVALWLALHHPDRVDRVATLGTVLEWSPERAATENRQLDIDQMRQKVPRFVEMLEKIHPNGWIDVADKTRDLLTDLGSNSSISESEWYEIKKPVRIHTGDRDRTATPESALRISRFLPDADVMVIPGSHHPIQKVNLRLLGESLMDFFTL